ncbi:hypothetical protein [Streptomyces boncukensis]|uniref:Uncharacterized protein n=1 Tax=Streptomyces boncukensis TaxID=2711219 RepID=A0A6G4X8N0_9ACTN|nr:hypothetical protein [Streptomyces boncukensis]NGO73738.1 hypothetical protein [Streptomyces boncukensis]
MPHPLPPGVRRCPHCGGFAAVAVDTGHRHPDGTRKTLHALCPACRGTGHAPAHSAPIPAEGSEVRV